MTRSDSMAKSALVWYSSPQKRPICYISFSSSLHLWIIFHLSLPLSVLPLSLFYVISLKLSLIFPHFSHIPCFLPISTHCCISSLFYIRSHSSLSFLIASLFIFHSQHFFPSLHLCLSVSLSYSKVSPSF